MKLLPSAAFYIKKVKKSGKIYFDIYGGGFGHGTGMSQWGAKIQAKLGWDYQRILLHYFSGISIAKV